MILSFLDYILSSLSLPPPLSLSKEQKLFAYLRPLHAVFNPFLSRRILCYTLTRYFFLTVLIPLMYEYQKALSLTLPYLYTVGRVFSYFYLSHSFYRESCREPTGVSVGSLLCRAAKSSRPQLPYDPGCDTPREKPSSPRFLSLYIRHTRLPEFLSFLSLSLGDILGEMQVPPARKRFTHVTQ